MPYNPIEKAPGIPASGSFTDLRRPAANVLAHVAQDLSQKTKASGLDFGAHHDQLICTLAAALAAKPFVIFSGLSGAGKTRLAMAIGQWFGREHLHVETVRPNWLSPEALLGYEDRNSEPRDGRYSWHVPRSLEFMLRAARNPEMPYLLLLEEMNLAHVEQYFADVLSGMESQHPIIPNLAEEGGGWRLAPTATRYLKWPENLFLIGTINLDETTYKFSPKVLDRATTIEFRVPPGSLHHAYRKTSALERGDSRLVDNFLVCANHEEPEWPGKDKLAHSLQQLHRLLFEYDAEFGHRVFRDSLRFGAFLAGSGQGDPRVILDIVLLHKILPKMEHSPHSWPALQALTSFALYGGGHPGTADPLAPVESSPVLPLSLSKIRRIARAQASTRPQ